MWMFTKRFTTHLENHPLALSPYTMCVLTQVWHYRNLCERVTSWVQGKLQHHVCLDNEISLSSCTLEALYPQATQLIKTSQFRLSRVLSQFSQKQNNAAHIFTKQGAMVSGSILGVCHTLCHWPGGICKFQLCNSLIHLPHIGCLRNGASRYKLMQLTFYIKTNVSGGSSV